MPDWYPVILAAKFLEVAPWDLVKQPQAWTDWALGARLAEAEGAKGAQRAAKQRQKPRHRGR
jgi:hypothetical protein